MRFCAGFKSTSSYDRLWEARIVWGVITSVCRS
jgi:predicted membrane chloride channel (bestrophin family)